MGKRCSQKWASTLASQHCKVSPVVQHLHLQRIPIHLLCGLRTATDENDKFRMSARLKDVTIFMNMAKFGFEGRYNVFVIACSTKDAGMFASSTAKKTWDVRKRYSEFETCNNAIGKHLPLAIKARFPPKHWAGSGACKMGDARWLGLDLWVRAFCASTHEDVIRERKNFFKEDQSTTGRIAGAISNWMPIGMGH